ncbi:MAG: hypothetical protein ACI4JY_09650 [Oscillospiraceae bacterium]
MYCSKCGKENGNSAFCRFCGAKLSGGVQPQYHPQPQMPQVQMNAQPAKKPTGKKVINRIAMIVSITAAAVVIALPIIALSNSPIYENLVNNSGTASVHTSTAVNSSDYNGDRTNSVNTGVNVGENTTNSTVTVTQPETPKETYTSSKTGSTFTVPDKGNANILCNNTKEMTVPAENAKHTITQSIKYDNTFYVYVDGLTSGSDCFLKFDLQSQNGWGKGTTYSLSDMKEQYVNDIMQQGFYTSKGYNYSFSWEKYGNVFKDAQFKIIDYTKSTGEMKWYFYVKMSGGGTDCIVEGVAHTVLGENPSSSSGDSSGGSSSSGSSGGLAKPGEHKCGVCQGKGKVKCTNCDNGFQQCPTCHGAKTYYSYAQKRDVVCSRCNGGGTIKCTRSDCVGGYKKCTSCGGDGYT